MSLEDLKIKNTIIIFDRDIGVSIFKNFRGYDNLVDDAEWLLERTPQKSRGFIMRPINVNDKNGIWIGEYNNKDNQVIRQNFLFNKNASTLNVDIAEYDSMRITEENLREKISIKELKRKLDSNVVRNFRYYVCPPERFYGSCLNVENAYNHLVKKYGKGKRIPYHVVAEEIEKLDICNDVVVCPISVSNMFERVLNFNKAIKGRIIGEVLFTTSDEIELR